MNRDATPPPPGGDGQQRLSYDVRIWKTRTVKGVRGRAYQVRWTVAGKVRYATFATKALADSHEATIKTATREGQAFDIATGLPLLATGEDHEQEQESEHEVSWYEFASAYVDMKWQEVAPNSRRAIADALATATPALLVTTKGAPKPAQVRKALYGWAFNSKLREAGPPAYLTPAIEWIERNSVPLADLGDPDTLRRVLNQLARKLDGTPAAATVVARKRAVLFNLLGYAVDKKHFRTNPLMSVRWKSPKVAEAIDRRRVVNPRQAQALLEAVAEQGPMGRHLKAFFGCIYYAAVRPSEALMLTLDELQLPDRDDQWAWLNLCDSAPATGGAWNETGNRREPRQLKHRAVNEVRPVPASPPLAKMLREHIEEYGTAPDGRLFRGEDGGLLSDTVYTRTWEKARQAALSPRRSRLPPRRTTVRPPPRPPVHLAQRRCRPSPSRRVGRQQRPRAPPRLRQMPHRLRANRPPPHRRSRSTAG